MRKTRIPPSSSLRARPRHRGYQAADLLPLQHREKITAGEMARGLGRRAQIGGRVPGGRWLPLPLKMVSWDFSANTTQDHPRLSRVESGPCLNSLNTRGSPKLTPSSDVHKLDKSRGQLQACPACLRHNVPLSLIVDVLLLLLLDVARARRVSRCPEVQRIRAEIPSLCSLPGSFPSPHSSQSARCDRESARDGGRRGRPARKQLNSNSLALSGSIVPQTNTVVPDPAAAASLTALTFAPARAS